MDSRNRLRSSFPHLDRNDQLRHRGSPVVSAPASVEKALIGKMKQELLACTAVTPDEHMLGDTSQLMFYKEASLLEESFPVSKASSARVHHDCLAHIQLIVRTPPKYPLPCGAPELRRFRPLQPHL